MKANSHNRSDRTEDKAHRAQEPEWTCLPCRCRETYESMRIPRAEQRSHRPAPFEGEYNRSERVEDKAHRAQEPEWTCLPCRCRETNESMSIPRAEQRSHRLAQ
jgi:hypothetical protein